LFRTGRRDAARMDHAALVDFWQAQFDALRARRGWRFVDIGLHTPPLRSPMWCSWPVCVWPFAGDLVYRTPDHGWHRHHPGELLVAGAGTWKCRQRVDHARLCKIEWHASGLVLVRNDRTRKRILRFADGGWLRPCIERAASRHDEERRHHLRATVDLTLSVLGDALRAGSVAPGTGERQYWKACDWIREHLAADCGRERVAAAIGCHPVHVSRLFTRHAGIGLGDWVRRQRVAAAGEQLHHTADDLATVARRCGFGSASYLIRCFKAEHGTTPDRWRRRATQRID